DNSGEGVWADSAYRSKEMEKVLKERGYRSHVHRKGSRNRPLGRWAKYDNSIYSVVRAEHVFGSQSNDMGGRLLRSIGVVRAGAHIGLKNLVYNMRRLVYLEGAARGV
ncbi:MAG: transposase, partial [Candidatus Dadabacteria bacterium]|nr:transposase [Candidatus Dadabacteria bacterium]